MVVVVVVDAVLVDAVVVVDTAAWPGFAKLYDTAVVLMT